MEYEVRITLQAQAHLREIRDYIAQKLLAPEAAKSTVQRLGTVMASLSQMPKRVPLVEEEPWRSEGVRVKAIRNFLIYFWVNEAEKTVQIIAVIYARRDQTTLRGVEDAPGERITVAQDLACGQPAPAFRHRNICLGVFDADEALQDFAERSALVNMHCVWHVFPHRPSWIFSIGAFPHFSNNAHGFIKEAGAAAVQPRALSGDAEILANRGYRT